MRLIRITKHPHDADIVLLATPPEMNTDMGRFEPARYAPELRAYLIHRDTVEALRKFAKHVNAHVIDERRTEGARTLLHECGNCAQPGSTSRPPQFCPSCGEPWRPVTFEEQLPDAVHGTCSRCSNRQSGRFPRCSRCGGEMTYEPRGKRVVLPRPKLADPMPLSEALQETLDHLGSQESA